MNGIPAKASEKLEALHIAAVTVTDNGKTKVRDIIQQSLENIERLKQAFAEVWHHELATEARARVAAFARETARRVREGAPLLSPALLYHELRALLRDRVWRRGAVIFLTGVGVGFACGCCAARAAPVGPQARALLAQPDQTVMLVEDAAVGCAGPEEVLIRVQAFSVCPLDRAVLRGHAAVLRGLITRTHLTVGRGFAGVVLDAGAGVDLELGDEVWGALSEWSGGAAAELLTVRRSRVSKRPAGLGADAAAALPWAGAAALAAARELGLDDQWKGKRVLVLGAASGEGCALVQLLSRRGVHVTAAAPRHAAVTLGELGAAAVLDPSPLSWGAAEAAAAARGPWDAVVACAGAGCPAGRARNVAALLRSTAVRRSVVDLRPAPLLSDRLPPPLTLLFAAGFYAWRAARFVTGHGLHTDWLEPAGAGAGAGAGGAGLAALAAAVDAGDLAPVLDKVFIPQEFESALAHACSDEAVGTTVIRFP